MKALREVMPGVSRSSKAGLRDLVARLAIHPNLGEIGEWPSVPVIARPWPGVDATSGDGPEDEAEDHDDGKGQGHLGAFAVAELSHVDSSNTRISEDCLYLMMKALPVMQFMRGRLLMHIPERPPFLTYLYRERLWIQIHSRRWCGMTTTVCCVGSGGRTA